MTEQELVGTDAAMTVNEKTIDKEVIEGIVTAITDRVVMVDIGLKVEGVVPIAEFRANPNLTVGDKVEVYAESRESPSGQIILSYKKAQLLKSWDRVNEAYESGEIINGYVKSRTRGGFIVEVFYLEAFLPGSQIDIKPIRDYDVLVGSVMEFKVVKINQEFKNVVVSHKAVVEAKQKMQGRTKKANDDKIVYSEIVGGVVDWFRDDKGYGVINLFDDVVTTEGEKVSGLFLLIGRYKKNLERPVFISDGEVLFSDRIVKSNDKVAGSSWHRAEWTERTLTYIFDVVLKHPEKRYLLGEALEEISTPISEKELVKVWNKLVKTKAEEELLPVVELLFGVCSKTNNASIKDEIEEVTSQVLSTFTLKNRLALWTKDVFDARQFDCSEYHSILQEGINIEMFYKQLDEAGRMQFTKAVLNKNYDVFDFDEYNNFVDACLKDKELEEETLGLILKIHNERVVPFSFDSYLEKKSKVGAVRAAKEVFGMIPKVLYEQTKEQLDNLISEDILKTSSDSDIIGAVIEGLVVGGGIKMLKDIKKLGMDDFKRICSNIDLFGSDAKETIINTLLAVANYEGAFECAKLIDPSSSEELEKRVLPKLTETELFDLWKKGYVSVVPEERLLAYLSFDEEKDFVDISNKITFSIINNGTSFNQCCVGGRYKEWDKLFDGVKTEKEVLFNVVKKKMELSCNSYSRLSFQTYLNLFGYYLFKQKKVVEGLEVGLYYRCAKWILDVEYSNVSEVLDNMALFMPGQQTRVIKKLFQLFESEKIGNPLDDILKALSKESDANDSRMPLYDLTSRIVIDALYSFAKTGAFIADHRLFDLLLSQKVKSKEFKYTISDLYFDNCNGRTYGKFHIDFLERANGRVEKVFFKNGDYAYTILTKCRDGDFEYIVNDIKTIPGRRWDETSRKWIVPSSSEEEVMEFAIRHMFSVDLKDGKLYLSNYHFYNFSQEEHVHKNKFCDGRPNNNPYYKSYWCDGAPCFKRCIENHYGDAWTDYTMYDLCRILGFDLKETKGTWVIEGGKYIQFVGHINRFNDLLERLNCRECGQIMYPVRTSEFARYAITRFACQNESCPEHKHVVYLNRCFNGNCLSVIDSRDSKQCPNGWYICAECGMCCSTEKLKERRENLEFNDGYIPNNYAQQGHYEQNIFFCHLCGKMLTWNNGELYCDTCDKWKSPPVYRSIRSTIK